MVFKITDVRELGSEVQFHEIKPEIFPLHLIVIFGGGGGGQPNFC